MPNDAGRQISKGSSVSIGLMLVVLSAFSLLLWAASDARAAFSRMETEVRGMAATLIELKDELKGDGEMLRDHMRESAVDHARFDSRIGALEEGR